MSAKAPERFKAVTPIRVGFLGARDRFIGQLVNISTTGILIRCSRHLELGTMGRLGIEVGQEMFRVLVVARRRVDGIGVAFQYAQMSQNDRQILRRLLSRLSQQSFA